MTHRTIYPVPEHFARNAHINESQYHAFYERSIAEPDAFWDEQARRFISWVKPASQVCKGDFTAGSVRWFVDGQLNVCYNCVDRHLETRKDQTAIIWEGNSPEQSRTLTYGELHERVCKFANVLKGQGVKKGDRVSIYLPMIPEAAIAMLACARIGAIHSVVFAGFSPDSLKMRINDADCSLLITADEGLHGEKTVPLKKNCDEALKECPGVKTVIVVQRTGNSVFWQEGRDLWYHELMDRAETDCPCEVMDANDPLFILYTSGSTGKPKGVLHGSGGYLVYTAITHRYVFDYHDGDIYWCTADIGWITGHSYLVYGPLANGATTLLFEGVPQFPDYARYWNIIDKYQVNIFYTAPTAIRALRKQGDGWVRQSSRQSLKLLGSVGEPINPDVWEWYFTVVGESRCPVVDTWWQTETGGILMAPLPGTQAMVPGSVSRPFFGIVPDVVDDKGMPVPPGQRGRLVIKKPWPGMMLTIYGDHKRFVDAYLLEIPGCYLTGDGAYRDEAGYYWVTGRNDDVIMVSGHRLGTGELESALLSHPAVSEAAVVGVPDQLTGESIYAFVTLKADITPADALKQELIQQVREKIGAIAKPRTIQWAESLPKTRSGKIMRRILRKIARDDLTELGDISTLADPNAVKRLIAEKGENH
ncbi:acetate--CoA ligase [Legionella londiniensis]|uniref:acetate--CoA ligase n=1 Tax=Legionella londiniensis TaxID=45068 RepID=UPI00399C5B9A